MSDDLILQERKVSYHGFVRLVTWSTIAVVITLALMAAFLL
jgi:hypothetical protein